MGVSFRSLLVLLALVMTSAHLRAEETQISRAVLSDEVKSDTEVFSSTTDSIYLYLPPAERTSAQLVYNGYSMSSVQFGSTTQMTGSSYDFQLSHSFTSEFALSLNTGFELTSTTLSGNPDNKYLTSGMKDILITPEWVLHQDFGNVIIGTSLGIPPEPASSPYSSQGNSTSGAYSVTPLIGLEGHAAGGVIGAKLSSQFYFYKTQRSSYNGTADVTPPEPLSRVAGFYEFPVATIMKLGVSAGVGHQGVSGDSWVNLRNARIYTEARVFTDTFVEGGLAADTTQFGSDPQTTTSFQIGLKRAL